MKKNEFAKFQLKENVEYILRDKNGNVKPIFVMNKLGVKLLKFFRKIIKNPIDEAGQVKKGFFNHLAAHGIRNSLFGSWQSSMVISNLVVSVGKAGAASRLNGAGGEAAFTYIALGTGTTAAAAGDTALQTEISTNGGGRANSTASRVTTTVTNDTAQLQNTFTFTGSFAITESGVLNAASVGTLLARQVFSAVNVISGDNLQITWKFAFS